MVNLKRINYDDYNYWTCEWSGIIKIKILEDLGGGKLLVQRKHNKKWARPFVRRVYDVYSKEEHARRGWREWERHTRKAKKHDRKSVEIQSA